MSGPLRLAAIERGGNSAESRQHYTVRRLPQQGVGAFLISESERNDID
jgi:hypothetical protein